MLYQFMMNITFTKINETDAQDIVRYCYILINKSDYLLPTNRNSDILDLTFRIRFSSKQYPILEIHLARHFNLVN